MQDATPKWLSATVDHEGHPLLLRVRPRLDRSGHTVHFPHLGTVSHQLVHVRPDGLPEPDYNTSLSDLDADAHEILEDGGAGFMMIVETFGGERNYYACLSNEDAHRSWLNQLKAAHPKHELDGDFRSNRALDFYQTYRNQISWPEA